MYVLHKEDFVGFWLYGPRLTRFRKRLVFHSQNGFMGTGDKYVIFEIVRTWYDNITREFFKETEKLHDFKDFLNAGWAVYDWRRHEMLYPTEEAARQLLGS